VQAKLVMLGETLDGHDLDMLVLGEEAPEKKKIWMIARQHPGETMAEWFVEGFLDRMLDRCVVCPRWSHASVRPL
jgi:murein tripeptide amidase MpaA